MEKYLRECRYPNTYYSILKSGTENLQKKLCYVFKSTERCVWITLKVNELSAKAVAVHIQANNIGISGL